MKAARPIQALLLATFVGVAIVALALGSVSFASEGEHPREIDYPVYPPAPQDQTEEAAAAKSAGCQSCHLKTDQATMHPQRSVVLGCTDCHGGDASIRVADGAAPESKDYAKAKQSAHVQPTLPETWEARRNEVRTYTLLNRESPEYVRFVNPSDYRVVEESCGACHGTIVQKAKRSIMATGAMLLGGASYNNGIVPYKRYILGEAYTRDGLPAAIRAQFEVTRRQSDMGVMAMALPLPAWETVPPADVFRIFERGGRNINSFFPETGLPNPQEEPGKPDVRASFRGPGTGNRISVPVLNVHKTRLIGPNMWVMGTKGQPGDFRSSGCAACHVVYANDRDWHSSGSYSKYGNRGQTATADPTIANLRNAKGEKEWGHPIQHAFSRAIPTSQCMNCHMHQPNMFVNSYLGYTMWDYESDAPLMWPEQQRYPSIEEMREVLDRNPEEASYKGKWADVEFLADVWKNVNPQAKDTQFADYHGHGWNFRAIFKRSRDGTLLDKDGKPVADDLPTKEKFERAVHMRDIHADIGMQCADCHFGDDAHGNGELHGEVAAEVNIRCQDCHGTADAYASLKTSGPASPQQGRDLSRLKNADNRNRFEWRGGKLYQRLILPPHAEFAVSQVKDSVTPGNPEYNAKAARAKLMAKGSGQQFGLGVAKGNRAHGDEEIA
ncbi:cytochrome c3 family protein, partial [Myxococcota bacterium]|nr:cytochrome c3 family protein [Myxococcota bacterium]